MKVIEIIHCDGCENKITRPERAWEWENVIPNMVVIVHPNNRCARAAESRLGITLR